MSWGWVEKEHGRGAVGVYGYYQSEAQVGLTITNQKNRNEEGRERLQNRAGGGGTENQARDRSYEFLY